MASGHPGTAGSTNRAEHALAAWQTQGTAYLRGLDDPAFLTAWAAVRYRLALTLPEQTADRSALKRLYDAMTDDYRRRARIWSTTAT